ncbi:MAG: hypothetical protein KJ947_24750 [Alphaproteobacteria bacterium]|nr:hypothetical protein [Alphaproteobacteria bacterium]MBU1552763.1 hypothetical protein [Alphaproteobacteria bacterium]MBU2337572.1 hypothetical protein [Alphaproteobacteria bacterium]MBU2387287.1 hypothetical protein [Alphaproteobacteria bacterium]
MSSYSSYLKEQIAVHQAIIEELGRDGSDKSQDRLETARLKEIRNHERSLEALRATLMVEDGASR